MNTAYNYIRVSTKDQSRGFSPDTQKRIINECELHKDFNTIKTFEDSKTGTDTDREEFQKMLSQLIVDKPNAIFFYKISRLNRSLEDFIDTRKVCEPTKTKLISALEGDVTEGIRGIELAHEAEMESKNNSQTTRDNLYSKYLLGWQPTRPPPGYKNQSDKIKSHIIDPDSNYPIIEMFNMFSTGNYSLTSLSEFLKKLGITTASGKPLARESIRHILTNPFYYGLIRFNSESKIGNHVPLITKELFDKVQFVLAEHRNFTVRRRKYDFLLRSFLVCGKCGKRFVGETHPVKTGNGNRLLEYYHCSSCLKSNIRADQVEQYFYCLLSSFRFTKKFLDRVNKFAKEYSEDIRNKFESKIKGLNNKISAFNGGLSKQRQELILGNIKYQTFNDLEAETIKQVETLQLQVKEIKEKSNFSKNQIVQIIKLTKKILLGYKQAPSFIKRHYLRFFLDKILIEDKRVKKILLSPFAELLVAQNLIKFHLPLPMGDFSQKIVKNISIKSETVLLSDEHKVYSTI